MKRIAIFASGTGSNALKIIEHFKAHSSIEVALVVSNKDTAGVLEIAKAHQIPTLLLEKNIFRKSTQLLNDFKVYQIDFIALAGFLWLIPAYLVKAFPNKIVNIHPALLPRYGGKGMYGHYVHEAVFAAKEQQSGMTIHYVNEQYDEGNIIFQASCTLTPNDNPTIIAQKVLQLEHKHYAKVIENLLITPKK